MLFSNKVSHSRLLISLIQKCRFNDIYLYIEKRIEKDTLSPIVLKFNEIQKQSSGHLLQKKSVLKSFVKLTGKHMFRSHWSVFVTPGKIRKPGILRVGIERDEWLRCNFFPVKFSNFLRTLFWQNTSRWLLLKVILLTIA